MIISMQDFSKMIHQVLDFGFVRIWPLPESPIYAHLTGRGSELTVHQAMRDLAYLAELVEALRAPELALEVESL